MRSSSSSGSPPGYLQEYDQQRCRQRMHCIHRLSFTSLVFMIFMQTVCADQIVSVHHIRGALDNLEDTCEVFRSGKNDIYKWCYHSRLDYANLLITRDKRMRNFGEYDKDETEERQKNDLSLHLSYLTEIYSGGENCRREEGIRRRVKVDSREAMKKGVDESRTRHRSQKIVKRRSEV